MSSSNGLCLVGENMTNHADLENLDAAFEINFFDQWKNWVNTR